MRPNKKTGIGIEHMLNDRTGSQLFVVKPDIVQHVFVLVGSFGFQRSEFLKNEINGFHHAETTQKRGQRLDIRMLRLFRQQKPKRLCARGKIRLNPHAR